MRGLQEAFPLAYDAKSYPCLTEQWGELHVSLRQLLCHTGPPLVPISTKVVKLCSLTKY